MTYLPMINPEERKTTAMLLAKAHTRGPIAARHPPSNIVNLGPILSQTKLVTGPDEKRISCNITCPRFHSKENVKMNITKII